MKLANVQTPAGAAKINFTPSVAKAATSKVPVDQFDRSDRNTGESKTSWFHHTTAAISGTAVGATAGAALIGAIGNGMGGDGLIFPVAGLLVGGAAGMAGGYFSAGAFKSDSQHTSGFHRTTGVVSGMIAGAGAGLALIAPLGNGRGAEGLVFAAAGLVGGALTGAVLGGVAAGRFPDVQA